MLADAPVVEERILGYIDNLNGFVVINTASAKKAEAFLTLLRKTLGTLSVVPINTNHRPDAVMTNWLKTFSSIPESFEANDECQLEIDNDEKSVVKCKHLDLTSDEIGAHIETGMSVTKLSLTWNDRVSFVLNADLTLKRLEFFETQDDNQDDDDLTTKFEADFMIMHGEITALLKDLISAFGGLSDG
ncbi:hypothetical protein VZ94_00860 [Methylocucumis oryzae]|uniref:Recombination-associated protein RdgC n=2 Tax=Methylocucumis oryzae TaxID=1632867 RepID=A0A0F3IMR9_9GAMM|nr:hypothetical protein VZ94_00860 [Methylocucumis oryzae]